MGPSFLGGPFVLGDKSMYKSTNMVIDTKPPMVRFKLKAKVIESGYPTFLEFAEKIGIHRVYLSKILNGHEWPSPNIQGKLAEQLGLSIRQLREML